MKCIYKPQKRAIVIVAKAVKDGVLKKLDGSVKCVDCGNIAIFYDHRDYTKPLDVSAVCGKCNSSRGHAKDLPISPKKTNTCSCGKILKERQSNYCSSECRNINLQFRYWKNKLKKSKGA